MSCPTTDQLGLWRRQYEELHNWLVKSREQFGVWERELDWSETLRDVPKFRDCIGKIKTGLRLYNKVMAQLPDIQEFTDEEIKNRIGKAAQLFLIARQVTALQSDLSTTVKKLHMLVEHPCDPVMRASVAESVMQSVGTYVWRKWRASYQLRTTKFVYTLFNRCSKYLRAIWKFGYENH